ncbi:hypothetical protein KKC13_12000 [bacterium]|nr:hypothetical protein [bacterium]MBU1958681.1 hypothetical protein [bacterium]
MDLDVKDTLAIIGSVTGLISICGAVCLKWLELKNKAVELKEEKKHQITKEMYQKLFSQKIELYIELQSIVNDFYLGLKTIRNKSYDFDETHGYMMYETSGNEIIETLCNSLEKKLENNRFIISESLYEQYQKIIIPFKNLQNEINNSKEVHDDTNYSSFYSEESYRFHKNNKKEISTLLTLIQNEIIELKSGIGFN